MSFPGVPVHHLSPPDRTRLRHIAHEAIEAHLHERRPTRLQRLHLPAALWRPGASFVTLRRRGELRGCIGTLEAWRPLAVDVADNAVGAASRDPRFAPVGPAELEDLDIKISVLGPPEPLAADDRDTLVNALRPGIDGCTVAVDDHRGTLLPSVWEQLPDAEAFVDALWGKAGLEPGTWPHGVALWRYASVEF